MLFICNMITALEHHVFKKMREAGFPNFFPGRTNVISNIYMNNRIAVILMHNKCQAVWKYIFFIRDDQFVTFLSNLFNQLCLGQ